MAGTRILEAGAVPVSYGFVLKIRLVCFPRCFFCCVQLELVGNVEIYSTSSVFLSSTFFNIVIYNRVLSKCLVILSLVSRLFEKARRILYYLLTVLLATNGLLFHPLLNGTSVRLTPILFLQFPQTSNSNN